MLPRRHDLRGIEGPTEVALRGSIVSPDAVKSPVTHACAALWQYYFLLPAKHPEEDELLFSGVLGDVVLVRAPGGIVRVPLDVTDVYFAAANASSLPMVHIPSAFPEVCGDARAQQLARDGRLHYRELMIASGRPVRLRATVERVSGMGSYRSHGDAPYAVCGDERAVLSVDVPEYA